MKVIKYFLFLPVVVLLIVSCGRQQDAIDQEEGLIEITHQQFESDSMQLGKIEKKFFESTIKCNGILVPKPNGIAKISAPLSGIVKSIHCYCGQAVEKNQPLIEIGGNEIIEIQKEFAEAVANFKRLKNEYERIKLLFDEKVTSAKDFIIAESEYKIAMAKYSGLKLKIETIGLCPSKIENGEFCASYFLKSPIGGHISRLNVSLNSYIDSQVDLVEIINPDMLQIKLSVFANDNAYLKEGQMVRFRPVNFLNYQFANLNAIGVSVDEETKSIFCYANIMDKKPLVTFVNAYLEAEIIIKVDTAMVLPNSALATSNNDKYILVLKKQDSEKYYFKKQPVKIGREFKNYFEILNDTINGMILMNGIDFI